MSGPRAEVCLLPSFVDGMCSADVSSPHTDSVRLQLTQKQLTLLMHGGCPKNRGANIACVQTFRSFSWEEQQKVLIRNNVMVFRPNRAQKGFFKKRPSDSSSRKVKKGGLSELMTCSDEGEGTPTCRRELYETLKDNA